MSLKKTEVSDRIILCDSFALFQKKKKKYIYIYIMATTRSRMPMTTVFKSFHLLLTFSLTMFKQGWAVYTCSLFAAAQQDL